MQLTIDGRPVVAETGETLLDLVRRLGLDTDDLGARPIGAAFAGEIFTLNYVPEREQDRKSATRVVQRRAVQASKGQVQLIRYEDVRGRRIYERTMLFVFFLAMRELYPKTRVHVSFAVGAGLYATLENGEALSSADVKRIRERMQAIVKADYKLERRRIDIDEAIEFFAADGQTDKVRLLEWRRFTYFDVYQHDDYMDYFYGEMAPSTGYVTTFDVQLNAPGLFLIRPSDQNPNVPAKHVRLPKLAAVFRESEDWAELMHCGCVADLNDMVLSGDVRTLIRVNEALHEKRFASIADEIIARGAVVSEFLPGTGPQPHQFPIRNRIMSGMSHGVVIVEAGERSGTSITAGFALEEGREVFAVPGRITDAKSLGPNRMIRCGEAKPVFSAADVLVEFPGFAGGAPEGEVEHVALSDLTDAQQRVVKQLREGEYSIDALCENLALPIGELNSILTELHFSGIIKQLPGRVYTLDTMHCIVQ